MQPTAEPRPTAVVDSDGDGSGALGIIIDRDGRSANDGNGTATAVPIPSSTGGTAATATDGPRSSDGAIHDRLTRDAALRDRAVRDHRLFPVGTDARMFATIAWLPVWLAVSTVAGMYLLPALLQAVPQPPVPSVYVLAGLAAGLLAWIGAGAATAGETTPSRVNPSSYDQLVTRIAEDEAMARRPGRARKDVQEAALADLDALKARIARTPPDEDWTSGIAYVAAWRDLHAIEVDLVDVLDARELDCALRHDEFRIDGSKLDKDSKVRTLLDEARRMLDADPAANVASRVRAIREAVNEFRDRRFDALVRDRIRVDRMSVLLGLGAWSLLSLAIAAGASREAVVAVSALYLVGAATGLFTQLRGGSTETLENVFGYGQAQVRQTVLISGLAGVAGAFVAAVVTLTPGADATSSFAFGIKDGATIADALALTPFAVVAAAVFGFAPGALTDRLSGWAKSTIKDLESTANAAASQGSRT